MWVAACIVECCVEIGENEKECDEGDKSDGSVEDVGEDDGSGNGDACVFDFFGHVCGCVRT